MPRTTCRRCGSPLDAQGYCTSKAWCPYTDRLQAGSPPGPRLPDTRTLFLMAEARASVALEHPR